MHFRMGMNVNDRWSIVRQSAETVAGLQGRITPTPVDVEQLTLSSLGTWLTSNGKWDATPYTELGLFSVEGWEHTAPMGRDQFVKLSYPGYLDCLGNKTTFVKETERMIEGVTDPVARLRQRFYMVVTEPVRRFDNLDWPYAVGPGAAHPHAEPQASRGQRSPRRDRQVDLAHAAVGRGLQVPHRDHRPQRAGQVLPRPAAVGERRPGRPARRAQCRGHRRRVPQHHARTATACRWTARTSPTRPASPPVTPPTRRPACTCGARSPEATSRPASSRPTSPRRRPAPSHLRPRASSMRYRADYVANGFAAAPGPDDPQLFAEVVDLAKADKLLADASPATFPGIGFGSTERSGGFVKPDQEIALLSRAKGTLGKLVPAGTGTFNPAQFLGAALPKLFGLFDLSEVLEALGIDKMPAFVTETLGAVQGLLADVERLTDAVEQAVADANQVIADAQAAAATPQAWATETKAQLEGLAGQLRRRRRRPGRRAGRSARPDGAQGRRRHQGPVHTDPGCLRHACRARWAPSPSRPP